MRLPAFALKRMLRIFLHGNYVEFKFIMPMMGGYQPLGQGLEQFIIGVNDEPYFDMQFYPNDFLLILNDVIYPNQEVQKILNIIRKNVLLLGILLKIKDNFIQKKRF